MDADGVGIDNEVALAGAQTDNAELLLQPTEQQPNENADDSTNDTNHSTFEEEDTANQPVIGTKVAQRLDVVTLVDNEHR